MQDNLYVLVEPTQKRAFINDLPKYLQLNYYIIRPTLSILHLTAHKARMLPRHNRLKNKQLKKQPSDNAN